MNSTRKGEDNYTKGGQSLINKENQSPVELRIEKGREAKRNTTESMYINDSMSKQIKPNDSDSNADSEQTDNESHTKTQKKKNQPNALFKKKSSQGESSRRAPCWKYFETIYNEKEGREYDYCLVTLVDGTRCREAYVHNGAIKNHNRDLKKKHEIKEIKYLCQ